MRKIAPLRHRFFLLGAFVLGCAWATAAQQSTTDWRALSLASFDEVWQTVQDTLVDPSADGLDWTAIRAEYRPKAEAVVSPDDMRQLIASMLERLHRSHFRLMTPSASPDDPPLAGDAIVMIEVRPIVSAARNSETQIVVTQVGSSAMSSGIRAGDIIRKIGDVDAQHWVLATASIADERARFMELWRRATRALYGPEGSNVPITVERKQTQLRLTATRFKPTGESVTLGNLPTLRVRVDGRELTTPAKRHVGVITFNLWMTVIDNPIFGYVDRYRKSDGLIFDLRGNPGGLASMIRGISGHVLNEPVLLGSSKTRDGDYQFRANPRLASSDGDIVKPFSGPVAILVDELTGSASECFAAALQDLKRARIFGQRTMGEALPAQTKRLSNGDVFMYAIGDFVTSTGRRIEGGGVTPDEVVSPTVAALAAGKDAVMEAALAWVDRQKR